MTSSVKGISLIIQIHQPNRLRPYRFFEIGEHADYFDHQANEAYVRNLAVNCYMPAIKILLAAIIRKRGKFKVSIAVSGIAIEQFERFVPELIDCFRALLATGYVEFLPQTYAHSLVWLKSEALFNKQLEKHAIKIESTFGQRPVQTNNFDYFLSSINDLQLDMTSIVPEIGMLSGTGHPFNLCVDLRIVAEQLLAMNCFSVLFSKFIQQLVSEKKFVFTNLPANIDQLPTDSESKDFFFRKENDYSIWLGNEMQQEAFNKLYKLEDKLMHCSDQSLISDWESLQTSDNFFFMNIEHFLNNQTHKSISHYPSPYNAFINYMNVLSDFTLRVQNISTKAASDQQKVKNQTRMDLH